MSQHSSPSLQKIDSNASSIAHNQYGANVSQDDESSSKMNISLILEARGLPNMDRRGKSDPFVVVYQKNEVNFSSSHSISAPSQDWKKIGQTETVYNNLNPQWTKTFPIEYSFGCNSTLKFDIYDRDVNNKNLADQDYIGQVKCTVAQVVLADNQRLTLQVYKKSARPGARTGKLTIRGEEQKGDLGDSATLQFAVSGLRRGKKPFYILSRKNRNDNEYSPVVYSEVHQSYNGPHQITTFQPITKSLSRLVNGDLDRELQVECQDFDRGGKHYRGGKATFTLKDAKSACAGLGTVRFNLKKKKSNGQIVDAGILIIRKCDISVPFSFLDYIQSGAVINTIIAVDMSNSNGNPSDPNSLHYNNPATPNEYAIALREVGGVLGAYDSDKQFPAFGFGAALPPDFAEPNDCFALTGYIMQPVCSGISGVVDMYYNALNHVAPFAPCHYAPVLEKVIRMTKEEQERSAKTTYTVLLLVTDGEFEDFNEVSDLICSAADLPLSIVIVGVGNNRFLNLEKLDGDQERLCSSDGTPCARDIVQFVQFHKHRHNPAQLSKEVLDEIPEQLVSYMRSKSIKPDDIANASNDRRPTSRPYVPQSRSPLRRNSSVGIPVQPPPMTPQLPHTPIVPHGSSGFPMLSGGMSGQPGNIQQNILHSSTSMSTPLPPPPGPPGSYPSGYPFPPNLPPEGQNQPMPTQFPSSSQMLGHQPSYNPMPGSVGLPPMGMDPLQQAYPQYMYPQHQPNQGSEIPLGGNQNQYLLNGNTNPPQYAPTYCPQPQPDPIFPLPYPNNQPPMTYYQPGSYIPPNHQ